MSAATADSRPSNTRLYTAIAVLLTLSVGVQATRDRGWAPFVPPNPTMWVQSGPLASRLALGFDSLVADIYWMRAVIYYGGKLQLATGEQTAAAQASNFDLLYPLLELVTTLDPHFKVAYRFGAIFLTEAYPNGPGRPDLAIALLQRGIENDSGRWEYFEDIAFVYYWWLKDFHKAAEWFKRAGEQPGAPTWLAPLAAVTLAEGGDRRSSRFLWNQIFETSDNEWMRNNAHRRLRQLDAMDALDELNRRVDIFTTREGRPPRAWRELATAVPYVLNPETGKIELDRRSQLWPLPTDRPGLPPS
jgi:tetratricopeptide (TPR) repeat protein